MNIKKISSRQVIWLKIVWNVAPKEPVSPDTSSVFIKLECRNEWIDLRMYLA